ncbi:hypothetical protein ASG19_08720 [Rhizobium sp. Leaf306]|nr:hypothetical protein ASG19_08720 [Rhizobium sp. Leaf306]
MPGARFLNFDITTHEGKAESFCVELAVLGPLEITCILKQTQIDSLSLASKEGFRPLSPKLVEIQSAET